MAAEMQKRGHIVKLFYKNKRTPLRRCVKGLKNIIQRTPSDWVGNYAGTVQGFTTLNDQMLDWADIAISVGPDCTEDLETLDNENIVKIFHVHGLTLRNPHLKETAWKSPLLKIAVSDYVKRELNSAGAKPIAGVIGNGIDTSEYYPEPCDQRNGIGTVYGQGVAKSPDTICRTFGLLYENLARQCEFFCFGSCPRPRDLPKFVQYHRLPTIAQARRIYSQCSTWFCASRSEGFAMPLLEAMACGCSVVTFDCGGCRDFIKDGENGLILPEANAEKLAATITRLIYDVPLNNYLAQNAADTASQWTWHEVAKNMETLLWKIVSHQPKEQPVNNPFYTTV
ncbi:glycosyltransferase family 4 protein [Anaerohalosphaera lusitana]|nr:glycosyltransferase [Anaerohalosphaera lusitana]